MGQRKNNWRKLVPAAALLSIAAGAVAATIAYELNSPPPGIARVLESSQVPGTNWPVFIRTPKNAPSVLTGRTNFAGDPVALSCSTCHATTTPNLTARREEDLKQFHQGLHYQHGELSCLSCHNAQDYGTLRLADGTALAFPQVMNLCAQCHGTQARDYQHGAHGGMTGYWDLSKGARHRNNCIDCHNPHAPKYQPVIPVFPPKDRGVAHAPAKGGKH